MDGPEPSSAADLELWAVHPFSDPCACGGVPLGEGTLKRKNKRAAAGRRTESMSPPRGGQPPQAAGVGDGTTCFFVPLVCVIAVSIIHTFRPPPPGRTCAGFCAMLRAERLTQSFRALSKVDKLS